jgi:short-subunit dehydrogenase
MARPVAVVTGASSGIGEVFARKLAAAHDLLLIARRRDRLERLASELMAQPGARVEVLQADLASEKGLALAAERIGSEANLDLLVNNAGFGLSGSFWQADRERLEEMHRLHVMAVTRLCHAALKKMVERNAGGIINVASVAGFVHAPGSASYGATKAWMTHFTEGLYLDLKAAKSAVKVQALCPGFTYSEFHDVLGRDRTKLAPQSWWLDPNFVVEESLRGLRRGKLLVVPDWKYRTLVRFVTRLPVGLRVWVEGQRNRT